MHGCVGDAQAIEVIRVAVLTLTRGVCVWTVYLLCGVQGLLRPALVVRYLYLEQTLTTGETGQVLALPSCGLK